MHKRKFTSTRFIATNIPARRWVATMLCASAPTLLPLSALANPADGRSAGETTARQSTPAVPARPAPVNAGKADLAYASGVVTLPNGKPAANATIYLTWQPSTGKQKFQKGAADANGKFDITIPSAGNNDSRVNFALIVTALVPGKGIAWTQAGSANPVLTKLQMNLMPFATLEGRMAHTDGTPVANEEVCLQSLTPCQLKRNGVNPTTEPTEPTHVLRQATMQQADPLTMLPLLPPDALATLCHATTDTHGKFVINDVPRETMIGLKPGGKQAMAAGSANTFTVEDRERQDAGLFVTTSTLRVKVRVCDLLTHQPLPQTYVMMSAPDQVQNTALIRQVGSADFHRFVTDANGEMTSPELLPGEYTINVLGCVKKVRVEPGHDIAPIEIAVRHGEVRGRLLDADGKPVPNAEVRLSAVRNNGQNIAVNGGFFSPTENRFFRISNTFNGQAFSQNAFISFDTAPFLALNSSGANTPFSNALPTNIVRTDANGGFVLSGMPWGSPSVRIWATKGNDLAEWSGEASKMNANLTLQMRRDALVTVSGKLVDPERRPLANVTCMALHWLSTPRATWFATARSVKTDAEGNFSVDGLERGESFSLITGRQQQQFALNGSMREINIAAVTTTPAVVQSGGVNTALETLGGTRDLVESIIPVRTDFESPRFLTCAAGDGQNLGEVMVHPQDTPDEVMQSYGGSPGGQEPLPGVVTAPAPGEVQSAQAVLARFEKALQTGDINTLTTLTSRVSPGWSRNRQEFLQHVSLCGRANVDASPTTRALSFAPRRAVAMLLQMASPAAEAGRLADDGNADGNWVFLTKQTGKNVALAGILHREDGQWRVVANPSFATRASMQMLNANGARIAADKWGQQAEALPADLQASAQQTGEQYLQAWLNADREQMRRLTSPFATLPSGTLAQFRHALEHRADDGVCPLATEEKIALQPVDKLTLWDQDWLKNVAGMNTNVQVIGLTRGGTAAAVSVESLPRVSSVLPAPPETLAPGNDTAVFRYTAQGHDFLMVLTRSNRQWQILEPALPL